MKINLLSCGAARPDKRAIARTIAEISTSIDPSLASELVEYLLDGTPVDIEVDDKTANSAYRALRKLDIEYELIE